MAILIEEIKKSERSEKLVANLVELWEKSVRATHTFLSESEILKIKEYVPDAICNVESLLVLFDKSEDFEKSVSVPIGFIGIENKKIEMLFLSPDARGKRFGKMLVQHGIEKFSATKVTVNEQNPKAKGFYEHLGFKTYKTSETDEQGNPYPIAWMKL
ncbi:MAG: GNAT family N-acetyltransferase [Spirochaetales bacterium]|nr:GNAT family N-acetyltransferase [Spirochaetales bacterium]